MKQFNIPTLLITTGFTVAFALSAPYSLAGDKHYDSEQQMGKQQSEQLNKEGDMRREPEVPSSPGAPNEMGTGPNEISTGAAESNTEATSQGRGAADDAMGTEAGSGAGGY